MPLHNEANDLELMATTATAPAAFFYHCYTASFVCLCILCRLLFFHAYSYVCFDRAHMLQRVYFVACTHITSKQRSNKINSCSSPDSKWTFYNCLCYFPPWSCNVTYIIHCLLVQLISWLTALRSHRIFHYFFDFLAKKKKMNPKTISATKRLV